MRWSIFGSGPTLSKLNESDLNSKPSHRISVNNAVKSTLSHKYWMVREWPGFKNNYKYGLGKILCCPKSWKTEKSRILNKNKLNRFNRMPMTLQLYDIIWLPDKKSDLYEMAFGGGRFVFTIMLAVAFAKLSGANIVNIYGVDCEGKYNQSKWDYFKSHYENFVNFVDPYFDEVNTYGKMTGKRK